MTPSVDGKDPQEQALALESMGFKNPWSEETQNIRQQLLVTGVIGLVIGTAGIFPKKIDAFGLQLDDINQRALLIVWAMVVGYLAVTYFFYCYSDFMARFWRDLFLLKIGNLEMTIKPLDEQSNADSISPFVEDLVDYVRRTKYRLQTVHMLRLTLDFAVPFFVGVFAVISLIWRSTLV